MAELGASPLAIIDFSYIIWRRRCDEAEIIDMQFRRHYPRIMDINLDSDTDGLEDLEYSWKLAL